MTLISIVNKRVHGYNRVNLGGTLGFGGTNTNIPLGDLQDQLFFASRFTGGVKYSHNGMSWSAGVPVTTVPVALPGTGTTHAMQFTFTPTQWQEQRFLLGTSFRLPDLYYGYLWFVPDNYEHLNGPTSDNNKFFRLWNGDESDGNQGYGQYYLKGGDSTDFSPSFPGDGRFRNEWGYKKADGTVVSVGQNSRPHSSTIITDAVRGTWVRVRGRCKLSTTSTSADGANLLYINDTNVFPTWTDLNWYSDFAPTQNFFKRGYFMGASNSDYGVTTIFHITNVRFGNSLAIVEPTLTTGWMD